MDTGNYILEKTVWSEETFDQTSWYEVYIHAFASIPEAYEFLCDIDFILQWVEPTPPEVYYKCWIAPATLVFENVSAVNVSLNSEQGGLRIEDLCRSEERLTQNGKMTSWQWTLEGVGGSIVLRATGYKQYLRRYPVFANSLLSYDERYGITFRRTFETQT